MKAGEDFSKERKWIRKSKCWTSAFTMTASMNSCGVKCPPPVSPRTSSSLRPAGAPRHLATKRRDSQHCRAPPGSPTPQHHLVLTKPLLYVRSLTVWLSSSHTSLWTTEKNEFQRDYVTCLWHDWPEFRSVGSKTNALSTINTHHREKH